MKTRQPTSFLLTAIQHLHLQTQHHLASVSFPPETSGEIKIEYGPAGVFTTAFNVLEGDGEILITNSRSFNFIVGYYIRDKYERKVLVKGQSISLPAGTPFCFTSMFTIECEFQIEGDGCVIAHKTE